MALTFDGPNKLVILSAGTTSLSVRDLWSRWVDWVLTSDNSKYLPAMAQVGGNDIDLTSGTKIPIYAFLQNGWRLRPQEASHTLNVSDGVLLVDGGGDPFVNTTGSFIVRINYQQPVQAISFSAGGGGGATAADIWSYGTRTLTSSASGLLTLPLPYRASSTTAAADPGAGRIRWNNATQASATALYIDTLTDAGLDISAYISALPVGVQLILQDKDNASIQQRWLVTSVTDNTGWMTIGVAPVSATGGNIANNAQMVAVFSNPVTTAPTAVENAAATWQTALEAGMTAEELVRIMLAALTGKTTGIGTPTEHYRDAADTKDRVVATFDANGNRITVAVDGA